MKVAFDTSVLVAGALAQHVDRERSAVWLRAAREGTIEASASTHAFAETWATLTAVPVEPRIAPGTAQSVIERMTRYIRPTALSWNDYKAAFERCAQRSLRSGALYDALHLVSAERHGASVFLTFNTRHFVRMAAGATPRILAPPDPPGLGDLFSG